MQQISMRRVNLEDIEAGSGGAVRGLAKGLDQGFDSGSIERPWHRVSGSKGHGAWRYRLPSSLRGQHYAIAHERR